MPKRNRKDCSICNRPDEGDEHRCDMVTLTDGRVIHADRLKNRDDPVYREIEDGKVAVKHRWINEPLKTVSERLGLVGHNV